MGSIKLEFDIPNFEKELKIEITLRKDGEVVEHTTISSPSTGLEKDETTTNQRIKEEVEEEKIVLPTKKKKLGGNMMDLEF